MSATSNNTNNNTMSKKNTTTTIVPAASTRAVTPKPTKSEVIEALTRLIAAAPEDLLFACKGALADLEGIISATSGDRKHPAWETFKLLKKAIKKGN